jgi:6-phosphogluconolactonase
LHRFNYSQLFSFNVILSEKVNNKSSTISVTNQNAFISREVFATGGKKPSTSKGIYVFKMDKLGSLDLLQVATDNLSFLTVAPSKKYLYCVNELGTDDAGSHLGLVSAYKIDSSSGKIRIINTRLTKGTWPCHCIALCCSLVLVAYTDCTGTQQW